MIAPLSGPPPPEVPLQDPPIARVIAQVRFPAILAIRDPRKIADFQEQIRKTYPILKEEETQSFVEMPGTAPKLRCDVVWRFQAPDLQWRASLSTDFLALDTSRYESRRDFVDRLRSLLEALESTLKPQEASCLGVRYIDRIVGHAADNVSGMVREEALGIFRSPIGPAAQSLLTQSLFQAEEGIVQATWGHLPPGDTPDPNALEPIEERSWILDLDASCGEPQKFAAEDLSRAAERYARRIYSVFRWMVTDEFLRRYGGKV